MASTLREFVEAHRAEIDGMINEELFRHDGSGGRGGVIPDPPPTRDDDDREMWVENYEPLWLWAKREGVADPE
jgi:hypothetical protein